MACRGGEAGVTGAIQLADNAKTLLIDTNPDDYDWTADPHFTALACTLDNLKTPQSIVSRIQRTNSLQGVQEGTADGIAYSWTYHPDSGNEMTITYEEATS
jgi:hypothetical protein